MQAVESLEQQTGVALQQTWLQTLCTASSGQTDLNTFWGAFLSCDLNQAGTGSLPSGLKVNLIMALLADWPE